MGPGSRVTAALVQRRAGQGRTRAAPGRRYSSSGQGLFEAVMGRCKPVPAGVVYRLSGSPLTDRSAEEESGDSRGLGRGEDRRTVMHWS